MSTELDTEIETLRRDVQSVLAALGGEHAHDDTCRAADGLVCFWAHVERAAMAVVAKARWDALREVMRYQTTAFRHVEGCTCLGCNHLRAMIAAAEALVAAVEKEEAQG